MCAAQLFIRELGTIYCQPPHFETNLYERGVLEPELIPRLWEEHPPRLQLQLLGMMVQVGRISEDYLLGKKKRGAAAL